MQEWQKKKTFSLSVKRLYEKDIANQIIIFFLTLVAPLIKSTSMVKQLSKTKIRHGATPSGHFMH